MSPAAPRKATHGQVINALEVGKFATLDKVIPCGSLEARKLVSGTVMLYWRITLAGKTTRVSVGAYDSASKPKQLTPTDKGYSVAAAMQAARVMAQAHQENLDKGGYLGVTSAAKAAEAAQAAEAEAQAARVRAAAELAAKYTMAALMNQYADHLQSQGRQAVGDVRSIIKHHIVGAWPVVAATQANQVTYDQIADMQRKLQDAGKGRTANKLRSYVRAAYQVAMDARANGKIPLTFKAFSVSHNPAADTKPDSSQNNPDKNPLSLESLRTYWQTLKGVPGFKGAVLRLHLLTGGQRIAQLVRLETSQIKDGAITLMDGKGKPGKGHRPHAVPLIPAASAALAECALELEAKRKDDKDAQAQSEPEPEPTTSAGIVELADGEPERPYALSTDGGVTHLAPTTLSNWAQEVAGAIPDFQAKQIRSGVETLLASVKVSTEIRGRLQSHGISGVQARHYDGHDYLDEKRQALVTLFRLLNAPEKKKKSQKKKFV